MSLMNDGEKSYRLLWEYALRLLALKSYTESEMLKKLSVKASRSGNSPSQAFSQVPPGAAAHDPAVLKVLARLKELDFLNDGKILENYLEYRLKNRPVGKFLFLREMHRRGIPFEKSAEEWEKRGIQEGELAADFVQRRARKFESMPLALRKKKIGTLLASRGFSADTVWDVLGKL
ncbi:regulatory protein RecX [Candidatus Peregrinibacteria bacterium]|nr:regulatory protein RecX [Candidatus Peregrinibacteria bacterium]